MPKMDMKKLRSLGFLVASFSLLSSPALSERLTDYKNINSFCDIHIGNSGVRIHMTTTVFLSETVSVLGTTLDTKAFGPKVWGTISEESTFSAQVGNEKFYRDKGKMRGGTRTTFSGTRESYPIGMLMAWRGDLMIAGEGVRHCAGVIALE